MTFRKIIFCFFTILLTAALVAISAGAQATPKEKPTSAPLKDDIAYQMDAALNPLMPADTSSPHDTLRSFLTSMNFVIDEWQKRGDILNPEGYRAYNRVLSTLDFSTTPDSDSRIIMIFIPQRRVS